MSGSIGSKYNDLKILTVYIDNQECYKKYVKRLDNIYYRNNSYAGGEKDVMKVINDRTRVIHNLSIFKHNGKDDIVIFYRKYIQKSRTG